MIWNVTTLGSSIMSILETIAQVLTWQACMTTTVNFETYQSDLPRAANG